MSVDVPNVLEITDLRGSVESGRPFPSSWDASTSLHINVCTISGHSQPVSQRLLQMHSRRRFTLIFSDPRLPWEPRVEPGQTQHLAKGVLGVDIMLPSPNQQGLPHNGLDADSRAWGEATFASVSGPRVSTREM